MRSDVRRVRANGDEAGAAVRPPVGRDRRRRRAGRPAAHGARHAAPTRPAVRLRARAAARWSRRPAGPLTTRTSPPDPDRSDPLPGLPGVLPLDTAVSSSTCCATRSTQTNEIGRCALLLPAFGLVAAEVGALAHLDVGTSAGLNLLLPRYRYRYEPGGEVGRRLARRPRVWHPRNGADPGHVPKVRRSGARPDTDRHADRTGPLARGVRLARPDRPVRTAASCARHRRRVTATRGHGRTPAALAGDWLASAIDQNAAMWVMSPAAAQTELVVLRWLKELFGLPSEWAGAITSGATMSNLVGLAAARQWAGNRLGFDPAQDGLGGHPPIPVVSSTEIHASAVKALGTLGLGRGQVRTGGGPERRHRSGRV